MTAANSADLTGLSSGPGRAGPVPVHFTTGIWRSGGTDVRGGQFPTVAASAEPTQTHFKDSGDSGVPVG